VSMRALMIVLCEAVVVSYICSPPANAQMDTTAPPPVWQPMYWDRMMFSIKSARQLGEIVRAESLCARALPYVAVQGAKALYDYADLLDSQRPGSGADARARAERLAQLEAQRSSQTKPTNTYLGFVVWDELNAFADALHNAQRESDSQAMRALSVAYKYSQEAYIRRTILMRQGKDPRGEC
jgi:hypothetical protein